MRIKAVVCSPTFAWTCGGRFRKRCCNELVVSRPGNCQAPGFYRKGYSKSIPSSETTFRRGIVCAAGKRAHKLELLWRNLFADPSNWWDNRVAKPNARFPDFKHKQNGEGLWLNDSQNPSWVASEVDCIAPGVPIYLRARTMSGHNKAGQYEKTIDYFDQMLQEGSIVDGHVFVHVLNACAALKFLEKGRLVHKQIIDAGCESNVYVGNSLIDMYAKCGSVEDSMTVFNSMSTRTLVSYNAMIMGFVKCGQGVEALELFQRMHSDMVKPDSSTFVSLLNACASIAALEDGRRVHKQVIQSGCEFDVYVSSSLVDMYAKCGSIEDARTVFDKLPTRTVVSWNAMIFGFVNCGQGVEALELFQLMQQGGIKPDSSTFVALLKACANIAALESGRSVHKQIVRCGCESNIYVSSSLVDMYAKCGSIDDARTVFDKMPTRDVVTWTVMITGLVKCGQEMEALQLFEVMQGEGVKPDSSTFLALLNGCASIAALEEGRFLHNRIIEAGCESNLSVGNCLMNMYAKCGSIEDAFTVFNKMPTRNVVSWNVMILGFVKCGQGVQSLQLFHRMQQDLVKPNSTTFVAVLNACASILSLDEGRSVHNQIIESGWETDVYVGNSLVDMYAKCGSIKDAWTVFNKIPILDLIPWNAMILGFVKCGEATEALHMFKRMQGDGIGPDSSTFVAVLKACASVGALEEGRILHKQIIQSGWDSDIYVGSTLVDMYAKCGSLKDAQRVFNKMPIRNVVSWTAMILGFAMHGHGKEAVALFEEMYVSGLEMNEVTFLCLLSACSHSGLLKEGMQYFTSMQSIYGVSPTLEHYTCAVDILGRAGHLDDAEALVNGMPLEPSASVWMALLAACRIHGNAEMGERAAKQVLKTDPQNAAGYVLLSNIYAASGHFDIRNMCDPPRLEKKTSNYKVAHGLKLSAR